MGFKPAYDIDLGALDQRYRQLQRAAHPDRHASDTPETRFAAISYTATINEAYRTLKDDVRRAEALLKIHGIEVTEQKVDQGFLMEMLELREAWTDAQRDAARANALINEATTRIQEAKYALASALEQHLWQAAVHNLLEIKYLKRFLDEVENSNVAASNI